ncbi:MAG: DUF6580 family putative transport protein [Balneolaceae bacterium]
MKKLNLESKGLFILLFMLGAAVWRVMMTHEATRIPEFSNFTIVGAMALFGGAYFSKWKGLAFPVLILWVSDIVLNKMVYIGEWTLFYEGAAWTYGAFALMALVGRLGMKQKNARTFLGSSLAIVLIHWIVTDIGVWLYSGTYAHTLAGFWACLVAAIPFEINLLVGTVFYGSILFSSFEYMKAKIPALQSVKIEVE